jgi:uncharacterized protein involved in exopolysaccharide biosynthesis
MRYRALTGTDDTIDLLDTARSIRRGWREVISFTLLGTVAAVAVLLFAPRRFTGRATIVLKSESSSATLLSKIGLDKEAAGGLIGDLPKTPMETEMQILSSRAVGGRVVDSLMLQARVLSPAGIPTVGLLRSVVLPGAFKRRKISLEWNDAEHRYRFGGAYPGASIAGDTVALRVGMLAFAPGAERPRRLVLELRDREDAIDYFEKHLTVDKAAGEVADVDYRGGDSLTAAAAANSVVAEYLARRRTVDRGVNEHRADFLALQVDSVSRALSRAEHSLRLEQEASGVIDPELVGKSELERLGDVRKSLTEVQVEAGAIDQLMGLVSAGRMSARQLAAFPTFIKSPAVSNLLGQITGLEAQRQQLLERRTPADPDVQALTQTINVTEGQLVPLATAYSGSLNKQRAELQSKLDSARVVLGALPAAAESNNRVQRDVLRLSAIFTVLQGQLVAARLAAIGEGGDARQLDRAFPPRKPSFPEPYITMGVGLGGGLLIGAVAALLMGAVGRWMRDPAQLERATGLPAIRFDPATPLLVGGGVDLRTMLVLPIDSRARTGPVARRLVQTALSRAHSATVLDLSSTTGGGEPGGVLPAPTGTGLDISSTIERLEREYSFVVVQLPGLACEATVAALRETRPVLIVAPPQRIDRNQLMAAVRTLERLSVPCAGIVLSGTESNVLGAG